MNTIGFDAEDWLPRTQCSFPLHQLAKIFSCSVTHLFNLIHEGEIVVPQEQIDRASSRACIVATRENLVDFVRRRSSAEWFARKRSEAKTASRKRPQTRHGSSQLMNGVGVPR